MWAGGECFIIGGGPSMLKQFEIPAELTEKVRLGLRPASVYSPYMSLIKDKHVIGVNNAYQLGNWIDCVFFGDCAWYLVHRMLLMDFPNLKVTCCPRWLNKKKKDSEGVKYLEKQGSKLGLTENPTRVAWNHNSGSAAINLAVHFGVKRIVLLGFDMFLDAKNSHWHKGHGHKNPETFFSRHMRGFPVIAKDAAALGVEILNASPNSEIKDFTKISLKDVL